MAARACAAQALRHLTCRPTASRTKRVARTERAPQNEERGGAARQRPRLRPRRARGL